MKLGRIAFFAVLFGIGAALVVVGSRDGAPPDDADLQIASAAPGDFANAQLTLTAAAALVTRSGDDRGWETLARDEDWDEAIVSHALGANENALRALARAGRQSVFASRGEETPSELVAWIDLARLQGIRAIALAHAGDASGAAKEALVGVRVARVTASGAVGSQLLREVAAAMYDASVTALRAVLARVELEPAASEQLARDLAALRSDPAATRAQLAAEYRAFAAAVPSTAALDLSAYGAALRGLAALLPASHLYQPNNTRVSYAKAARVEIAAASEACGAGATELAFEPTWTGLLTPNAAGRAHIDRHGALAEIRRTACRADTRLEALRAALAVRAFERERGTLPPSLEALVPTHLPDAPRDAFSGEPLRLDRAARALVSTGAWDRGAAPREERFPLLPAPRTP